MVLRPIIAALGIYCLLAYNVAQRTQEIGVRLALGAQPANVLRMVLQQAAALVAMGIPIGLLGAARLTRHLAAMLFGLSPLDLPTYVLVGACVIGIAMLASYVPARRATRVEPVIALRAE